MPGEAQGGKFGKFLLEKGKGLGRGSGRVGFATPGGVQGIPGPHLELGPIWVPQLKTNQGHPDVAGTLRKRRIGRC